MADITINSMNDYMDALGVLKPKETITVVINRGNKQLIKTITFD